MNHTFRDFTEADLVAAIASPYRTLAEKLECAKELKRRAEDAKARWEAGRHAHA